MSVWVVIAIAAALSVSILIFFAPYKLSNVPRTTTDWGGWVLMGLMLLAAFCFGVLLLYLVH